MDDQGTHFIQHDSEHGQWELVIAAPHPALRSVVSRYQGYVEQSTNFARRLEVPHPNVVMVINLGPAIRVIGDGDANGGHDYGSFIAGLYDRPVLVESTGPMRCLQVDLTVVGARLLLRRPMDSIVNHTVRLCDLFGATAALLEEQLDAAPTWAGRFTLLNRMILERLRNERPLTPGVVWSWQRLQRSAGLIPVAKLASEIGWSRKHLAQKFREEIGLPPKTFARLIRFDRAVRFADASITPNWAEIAHRCGYADQSHFNREFRSFAGTTPVDYLMRRIPDGGTLGD